MVPTPPLIVCVDGDQAMLHTILRCLARDHYDLRPTSSANEALGWIARDEVAVLVCALDLPGMTGAQLAAHARRVRHETVRILLTGKRTLDTALDGMHPGEIFRFLRKPFSNDQLRAAVQAAVVRNRELLELAGDHQRRERRDALRIALEAEHPGISQVTRHGTDVHVVTSDPWSEAAALGLVGLSAELERDD